MLSRPGEIVRRHDPDRFLATLFAPADKREALFTLYAFNHELARAREVAREPMMALIRLQWWREVVEGSAKQHEVATPLRQALDASQLRAEDLLPIIDAREAEAEPIETIAEWLAYLRASAGGLAVAAGHALVPGAAEHDSPIRELGAAYGLAGTLRNAALAARQGRCVLPADALSAAGLVPESLAGSSDVALQQVVAPLAQHGSDMLRTGSAGCLPRQVVPAVLTAVLARRDLARPARAWPRGLADRLAMVRAGMVGRIA